MAKTRAEAVADRIIEATRLYQHTMVLDEHLIEALKKAIENEPTLGIAFDQLAQAINESRI